MYEHGEGVGVDLARARELNERACALGYQWGCHNVAHMILAGAIAEEYSHAGALARQGCDAGHMPSCTVLGLFAERGLGMPVDGPLAVSLWEHACMQGTIDAPADGESCRNLAILFRDGRFVRRDSARV